MAESRIKPFTEAEHSTTDHSAVPGTGDPNPADVTQPEAEAGTEAANRSWSPLRVSQAIAALTPVGGELATADKKLTPLVTSSPGPDPTGITISGDPSGFVSVLVNNIGPYELGDGVKTTACYFSADGGLTARNISAIATGDGLYWNGGIAGFDLSTDDRIDLIYLL